MDPTRFDAAVRALRSPSRRDAARALSLGALLALAGGRAEPARARRKRCKPCDRCPAHWCCACRNDDCNYLAAADINDAAARCGEFCAGAGGMEGVHRGDPGASAFLCTADKRCAQLLCPVV